MASSSSIATPSSSYPANQPYRYNGKELDRKNGLDWMDYGARHFAGHGQWTSPDPLAEKYYEWSPYVYCVGNPIKLVDPDRRTFEVTGDENDIYYTLQTFNDACNGIILSYNSDNNIVSYTLIEDKQISDYDKQLINIINDKNITVELRTIHNDMYRGKKIIGGAFFGNKVESNDNGTSVRTLNVVNPYILNEADFFAYQGRSLMHELTESYLGGMISKMLKQSASFINERDVMFFDISHMLAWPTDSYDKDEKGYFVKNSEEVKHYIWR